LSAAVSRSTSAPLERCLSTSTVLTSVNAERLVRVSLKVRIHRLAVAEIDHEVDFDESCRVGLGAELEDEIDAVLRCSELRFHRWWANGSFAASALTPRWRARWAGSTSRIAVSIRS
jgi:hypothetical protein